MEVPYEPSQIEVTLRRFESLDETRAMEKGKFEVVHIGGLAVGRATLRGRVAVVRARWADRRR